MKKLYTLLVIVFIGFAGKAQIVNIPDANFKAKLLAAGPSNTIARDFSGSYVKIDTNNNNEIEVSEALLIDQLNVSNTSSIVSVKISDLTGLTAFSNMRQFYCFDNLIVTLDLTSFIDLTSVGCDKNHITNLNITGLTNLFNLSCETNMISSLDLSNKPNLAYINCPGNNLSSLNLSGLTSLTSLRANDNPYTSLDFTGAENINSLQCMGTHLSVLDVSNLHYLTTLLCGNTSTLVNIFMKNGSIESSLNLSNLPNLNYICVDDDQLSTIQAHVNAFSNAPNCIVNTYCSFVPGGDFYTIQTNSRYDYNSNGCDSNDVNIPFIKYSIAGNISGLLVSNQNGGFSIPVQAGTYMITPVLEAQNYFTVSPANATVTFPDNSSPYVQNFCIVPNGSHNDVEIAVIPVNVARPGILAVYKIVYKNKGTLNTSGTVSLNFDNSVTAPFLADPAASSQINNTLNWSYSNLLPFETREITIIFSLNTPLDTPPLNAGYNLVYTATILNDLDETPNDNTSVLNQIVLNSLDPNDKTCTEGTTITPTMVGQYVHYVIRFENDGTADAQNIVVKDMIDTTKFDITTLVPLNGSAPFTTRITNTNKVEFVFQNINLPYTAGTNTGYVAFKIKTKPTLVVGNTFSNNANIYFDYNAPIVTNTYTTTVTALGTQDFEFGNVFALAPVPAKSSLTITTKQDVTISSVNIYNTLGQLVQVNTNPNETIDVSGLRTGNYFIKIISDKGSASTKFIKE